MTDHQVMFAANTPRLWVARLGPTDSEAPDGRVLPSTLTLPEGRVAALLRRVDDEWLVVSYVDTLWHHGGEVYVAGRAYSVYDLPRENERPTFDLNSNTGELIGVYASTHLTPLWERAAFVTDELMK